MKMTLTAAEFAALKNFLDTFEDSEQLSEREYVLDLYELDPPISLDLSLGKDCLFIDGAAELLFSDEMDGWYIGQRIENVDLLRRALEQVGALGA